MASNLPDDEIERAEGFLEDAWWEDHDAWDFAAQPEPIPGLDEDQINRRLLALGHHQRKLDGYDRAAEAELARFDARVEQARLEIEERVTRNREPLAQPVAYLTRVLQLTAEAMLAKDPKRGSIAMPAGRIAVSGGGVEWVWPDDLAPLVEWAEDHAPEAVNHPAPTVDKAKLKAAVKDAAVVKVDGRQAPADPDGYVVVDGSPAPGVVVRSKPRTFTPEPSGEVGF